MLVVVPFVFSRFSLATAATLWARMRGGFRLSNTQQSATKIMKVRTTIENRDGDETDVSTPVQPKRRFAATTNRQIRRPTIRPRPDPTANYEPANCVPTEKAGLNSPTAEQKVQWETKWHNTQKGPVCVINIPFVFRCVLSRRAMVRLTRWMNGCWNEWGVWGGGIYTSGRPYYSGRSIDVFGGQPRLLGGKVGSPTATRACGW